MNQSPHSDNHAVSRRTLIILASGGAAAAFVPGGIASAATSVAVTQDPVRSFKVFSPSFDEDVRRGTVTFPRHLGSSHGKPVTYVVTDASTRSAAQRLGVNFAPRLANAKGTAAVQTVEKTATGIVFPATVDFRPTRAVVAGPSGFPPDVAVPGAVGEPGYSPLIELPDGTVLNAPHISNPTGRADKVVDIDTGANTVTYRRTDGFYEHKAVHYVSFEASVPVTAALENATLAPALDALPARLP